MHHVVLKKEHFRKFKQWLIFEKGRFEGRSIDNRDDIVDRARHSQQICRFPAMSEVAKSVCRLIDAAKPT